MSCHTLLLNKQMLSTVHRKVHTERYVGDILEVTQNMSIHYVHSQFEMKQTPCRTFLFSFDNIVSGIQIPKVIQISNMVHL